MIDQGHTARNAEKSPMETAAELRALLTDYARQETVTPLKRLGKWLAYGFAGALSMALGLFLLGLGVLRLLQSETSAFDGNWSWVPYAILFLLLALLAGLAGWAAARSAPDDEKGRP